MLSILNLSKSFHGKQILKNISFNAERGDIVVLLGKSGAGKSTVLRLLNNLDKPDSGSLLFDDKPLLFNQVGMVFQEWNLFSHWTVLQNIALPLQKVLQYSKEDAEQKAFDLLQQFGLEQKVYKYPQELSGGQKQRCALARTMAMDPVVLCLDEPTSALDPKLKSEFAHIVKNIASRGYIVIITTHDVAFIKEFQNAQILLMEHGEIVEKSQLKDLLKKNDSDSKIQTFLNPKFS